MASDLNFDFLEHFKDSSMALRLLRSANFSLIASFFYQTFIQPNRRAISYQELISLLDYHLADIADTHGEQRFPKSARAYIDDWINTKDGYLRKYLPQNADEPECDLQPEIEKVLRWIEDMQVRRFVGTESRLKLLLDLINELVHGTSENREEKLQTLRRKQAEIAQQIEAVELGMDAGLSDTEIRERLFLLSDLSRQLVGDFRQVEANFRGLDRDTRKKITLGGLHKGKVLDTVFNDQDLIDGSDEGKSFSAFFELLMTPHLRDGMRGNMKQLLDLEEASEFASQDELLLHLYANLLNAGDKVNRTKQQITDQLRRYIQEQSQDNKRILELIREFETGLHQLPAQHSNDKTPLLEIDTTQSDIYQILSRRLYQPKAEEQLNSDIETAEHAPDIDLNHLFDISHIDEFQLQRNISQCLNELHGQATLPQVIERHPIQFGLDEVLTYVKIACENQVPSHIDDSQQQEIIWQAAEDKHRCVRLPSITFVRP